MPDGPVFALPTLSAADMPRDDQAALVVNQATAVIVAAYLEHASAVVASGNSAADVESTSLIAIINQVQEALRQF